MPEAPTTPPPPPGAGGELAPEDMAAKALDLLASMPKEAIKLLVGRVAAMDEEKDGVVLAVRELEHHVGTLVGNLSALHNSVDCVAERIDELSGAVLVVSGRVAKLDERTKNLCELHEAGFRDLHDGVMAALRERKDDIQAVQMNHELEAQQTANTFAALAKSLEPTVVAAGRVTELAVRMASVETAVGEAPDPTVGRAGTGMRASLATLMADLQQRTKSTALIFGGSALAGGPLVYAVVEIIKALMGK